MAVHYDLVHASILRQHPERFFDPRPAMDRPLGELVSPLVIEADGRVVPFGYGFAERYSLGSIANESLPNLARNFRANGYPGLQQLCRSTLEDAARDRGDFPILNWWETLGRHALSEAPPHAATLT